MIDDDPIQALAFQVAAEETAADEAQRKELLTQMPTIAVLREGDQVNTVQTYDPVEYRLAPYLSQSALKLIGSYGEGLEEFQARFITGELESTTTPNQQFGIDTEDWIFDHKSNNVRVPEEVMIPDPKTQKLSCRGKAYTIWKEEQLQKNPQAELLKPDEYQKKMGGILWAERNVLEHPVARSLIQNCDQRHATIFFEREFFEGCEFLMKVQLDGVLSWGRVIWDMKTTQAGTAEEFIEFEIDKWGYHIQADTYRKAWHAATGDWMDFVFLCIQNKPPYNVFTVKLEQMWYPMAEAEASNRAKRLKRCYDTGHWHRNDFGQLIRGDVPERVRSKFGRN